MSPSYTTYTFYTLSTHFLHALYGIHALHALLPCMLLDCKTNPSVLVKLYRPCRYNPRVSHWGLQAQASPPLLCTSTSRTTPSMAVTIYSDYSVPRLCHNPTLTPTSKTMTSAPRLIGARFLTNRHRPGSSSTTPGHVLSPGLVKTALDFPSIFFPLLLPILSSLSS